ncbi:MULTISPECIES: PHP domain-containing protein [Arsenicicoccus]|uniref:PHP domain-containing protein n=1 Tax=Arsenicicoccus TaxID=267408 RepID=UPI00257B00CC|nr:MULTISPECIES: PHP domain-containing protein [Arsenicicoccus]
MTCAATAPPQQDHQPLPHVWDEPVTPLPTATGASRRRVLTAAGAAGAAALGAGLLPGVLAAPDAGAAPAGRRPRHDRYDWLVGDHHVHTVFSHDAKYLVETQVARAHEFGVDWMVFTEHSNVGHHDKGAHLERQVLQRMRRQYPDLLIYQGLEWYIPAAEHCTVMVAPGDNDADLLRQFERLWDGKLNRWEKPTPGTPQVAEWEAKAVEALRWLAAERRRGVVDDVLVLANHPLRLGIDSPHELRAWRDAAPEIMIGMEGAPGAQAGAFGTNRAPGYQRGEYENAPSAYSWPGYPLEAYRTRGGFDWASSVVGGLWDSLLAEGQALLDHHQLRPPQRVARPHHGRRVPARRDLRHPGPSPRPRPHRRSPGGR